jgi:hypothetical protein
MLTKLDPEKEKEIKKFIAEFKTDETSLPDDQIRFLFYYYKFMGVLSKACKAYNISHQTIHKWRNKSEEFEKSYQYVNELIMDFIESSAYQQVQEKNTSMTIFMLKTKCKKRGYSEQINIEHSGNISNLTLEQLSDEQLERIVRGQANIEDSSGNENSSSNTGAEGEEKEVSG